MEAKLEWEVDVEGTADMMVVTGPWDNRGKGIVGDE